MSAGPLPAPYFLLSGGTGYGQPPAEVFRIIDGVTRKTACDPMEMAVEQNRTVGLTVNCVLIRRDGLESSIEDSAAQIHGPAASSER
jgi:hypothetical protein